MRNKAAELGPGLIPWWQDWRGLPSVVIGTGPSASTAGVEKLQGKVKVIAVNDAYKIAPWADVLYSCDLGWWQVHKGVRDFAGLKLTFDRLALHHYKDLKRIEIESTSCDTLLIDRPTYLGSGGNSGFQMLNLAIQFGSPRIGLIGIDCTIDHGLHFFGRHPVPLSNPYQSNVDYWLKAFNAASAVMLGLGIEIVNCSQISRISAFKKMSVDELIRRWCNDDQDICGLPGEQRGPGISSGSGVRPSESVV